MAAKTEAAVRHNTAGRYHEVEVDFADIDDGDTFDARRVGMTNVVTAQARVTGSTEDVVQVASITGARTVTFEGGSNSPVTLCIRGN